MPGDLIQTSCRRDALRSHAPRTCLPIDALHPCRRRRTGLASPLPGHYELDMSLPIHRLVAARLRDQALAEPEGPSWINLVHDSYSG